MISIHRSSKSVCAFPISTEPASTHVSTRHNVISEIGKVAEGKAVAHTQRRNVPSTNETEADTRANRIDPALRDAGWGVLESSRVNR